MRVCDPGPVAFQAASTDEGLLAFIVFPHAENVADVCPLCVADYEHSKSSPRSPSVACRLAGWLAAMPLAIEPGNLASPNAMYYIAFKCKEGLQ